MNETIATISKDEINVKYSLREEVNREFLSFAVDGWEDVKKMSKKVLVYEGKKFVFSGWNSDSNECYFYRLLSGETNVATISSK